jgi:dehydrogenase/reductase SDR family protein 1
MQPFFNVPYGVSKAGLDQLTDDTAAALRPHNVAVISLWPQFTRTEIILGQPDQWSPAFVRTAASPQLTGRAVAALTADATIIEKSGRALVIAALAQEYGFTDLDGTQPPLPPYTPPQ